MSPHCQAVNIIRIFIENLYKSTALQLRPFQFVISVLLITVCTLLFVTYGKTAFATLTERSGFYGSLYIYYGVHRIPFGIYNLFITLLSFVVITLHVKSLFKNNKVIFKRACWLFLSLAILLIIGEIYLQMHFQGKG